VLVAAVSVAASIAVAGSSGLGTVSFHG
jgi:hypothetical protein